jgi:hypothetical protein
MLGLSDKHKQHILSPAKVRKVCYSVDELEFIRVERGVKFMRHFKGGAGYTSLGTSGIYTYNLYIIYECVSK